ncbi:MAG: ParM/StbA family protein [Filifactoraceae bacterium]
MFKFIKNIFKRNDNKIDVKKIKSNMVCVDPGASSYKMIGPDGTCINFRSSVRKINNPDEVTIQKSCIKVNGEYYSVGETTTQTSKELLKHQKEYYQVLILYGLTLLGVKSGDVRINMLLPFPQLRYKNIFKKTLERNWDVKLINSSKLTYNIKCDGFYSEGEMSKYHIDNIAPSDKDTIVCNIGYSTLDWAVFDDKNNRMGKPRSIGIGMRNLYFEHSCVLGLSDITMLSTWYNKGHKPNNEDLKLLEEENRIFVENFMNNIYIGLLSKCCPTGTRLVLCGGGGLMLHKEIRQFVRSDRLISQYEVDILSKKDCLYTDVLGMRSYILDNVNEMTIEDVKLNEDSQIIENDIINEETQMSIENDIDDIINIEKSKKGRLNYDDLVPKVKESYPVRPTIKTLKEALGITERQARTLISKCY